MYKINLLEIKIFLTVSKYKNFSRAADTLFISQPTVTKWIKRLEAELGFPLLERNSKSVTLTPAGELLYQKYQTILDEFEQATNEAAELCRPTQRLQIGALYGYEYETYLQRYVTPFEQTNPGIQIDFNIYNLHELNELTDTLDIIFTNNFETVNLNGYQLIQLDSMPFFLAVAKKHPLARKKNVKVAEIMHEKFLIFPPEISAGAIQYASEAFHQFGIDPEFIPVLNTPSQMMHVSQNHGVAITSRPIVKGYEHEISLIRLKDFPISVSRIMAFRPQKLSLSGKAFYQYVQDHFPDNHAVSSDKIPRTNNK